MKKIKVNKLKPIEYIFITAILLGGILADQLTKILAINFLKPIDTLPIIDGVIHLTYLENPGAAFGMLADARWVFMVISTVAIIGMGIFLYLGKSPSRLYTVAIALVVSGGIGNMIDRIAFGYVVDFIDFRLIDFAIFNGADSFVCIGAGLLILALILDIIKESRAKKKEESGK